MFLRSTSRRARRGRAMRYNPLTIRNAMRNSLRAAVWLALPLLVACADELPTITEATPPPFSSVTTAALPAVRFSEIHYDNTGTDTGETIEISGPAGTDLTGWQVVLYKDRKSTRL